MVEMELEEKKRIVEEKFDRYLTSRYAPVVFDSYCGEPVGWGYKLGAHMSDSEWQELCRYGTPECFYPNWVIVLKYLTRQEAIEKHGEQTNLELGPRGGFRSITFGNKKFLRRALRAEA